MSSEEYAQWVAYNRVHPLGGFKEDFLMARLMHMIAAVAHGFSGKGKTAFNKKLEDFNPFLDLHLGEKPKTTFLDWVNQEIAAGKIEVREK